MISRRVKSFFIREVTERLLYPDNPFKSRAPDMIKVIVCFLTCKHVVYTQPWYRPTPKKMMCPQCPKKRP